MKFCGQCATPLIATPSMAAPSPQAYTPAHLAEKILTSRAALEGERKQVTVLFADLKGSMELLADRFHLLQNLAKTLDQVFSTHGAALKAVSDAWSHAPVAQPDGRMAMLVPRVCRRPRHRYGRRSAGPGGLQPMNTCRGCTARGGRIARSPSTSALGA
jgi:class 3 adenylate cyclase